MRTTDWLVPCYRENAGLFWHGLPMEYVLLHWMGDERGNEIPDDVRVTPLAIPIGIQMLHAAGLAWSHKYRGKIPWPAPSSATGHERRRLPRGDELLGESRSAGDLLLPEQLLGHLRADQDSMFGPTIAQRGLAYGMDCIQVDGNDHFAVVKAVRERPNGPDEPTTDLHRSGDLPPR